MTELNEKIDNWLIAKDFPTSVPYEMKLLAFIGQKSLPRKKGAPKKPISNNARRALIFLVQMNRMEQTTETPLSNKAVIEACIELADKRYKLGKLPEKEKSLWAIDVKSIQNTLRKGIKELADILR